MLDYRSGKQTEREKWKLLLQRRDARAAKELAPILYPRELEYLQQFARDLYETSKGEIVTWGEIESWQHVNRISLLQHEIRPLRRCISAMQSQPSADAADSALDFNEDYDDD